MNFLKPAHRLLEKYYRNQESGSNLKLLVNRSLTSPDPKFNAAVTRTVYGVIRNDLKLSLMTEYISSRKISKLDIKTAVAVKTALFLLFFSDSYAQYAVVNETVNGSPGRSKSFINAVLRNSLRKEADIRKRFENHEDPSVNYSINPDIISASEEVFSKSDNIPGYLYKEPVFHLHNNPEALSMKELRDELDKLETDYRYIESMDSLEINNPGSLIKKLIKHDKCYIQNSGSRLISIIAAEFGKKRFLDICAAPGTKSITLHNLRKDADITASDISPERIKLLAKQSRRRQLPIRCLAGNAEAPALKDCFDFIIIDAPCSSVGTCRKNPDLKTKTGNDTIDKNSEIQETILKAALKSFPSSEYILYSVCSFTRAETEDILASCKASHSLETVDLTTLLEKHKVKYREGKYGYYLLPDPELNCDLFYFSLIKNNN